MAVALFQEQEALCELLKGADDLADTVRGTLGPRGRNVAFDQRFDVPLILNQSRNLIKEFELPNRIQNMGARLLKEMADRVSEEGGDGTTSAIVLAQAMLQSGRRRIASGANPMELRKGMEKALDVARKALQDMAKPLKDSRQIRRLACLAGGMIRGSASW